MADRHERPSKRTSAPPRRALDPRGRTQAVGLTRSRMIAAAIAVVEADGYAGLTIAKVTARARVSHKTFCEAFGDCEGCYLAAFEQTLQRVREIAQAAYSQQADWRSGMRAVVVTLLMLMERERGLARLCVVEALNTGPLVLDRHTQALEELAAAIDAGRAHANANPDPQPLTAQAIAGGIAVLLHTRLRRGDAEPLTDLLGSLMSMIVMPYMGRAAARDELSAAVPPTPAETCTASSQREFDVLEQLDTRLTGRTVRVLAAIAETPEASNRRIAKHAGIVDQGQISKLLRRLAGLGLIENANAGRATPRANAWRLTALGAEVQAATHVYG